MRRFITAMVAVIVSIGIATPAEAILGGSLADYPWMVAFVEPKDGRSVQDRYTCSGVLIKPSFVVTASHCTYSRNGDPDFVSTGDTVVIGRKDLPAGGGETRKVAQISRMNLNSTYCPSGKVEYCDIAVIRLDSPSTKPDADLVRQWEIVT